MKTGHKIIFRILASQRLFIAIAASPAPRKIPLIRKSNMITRLLPNMILVKMAPSLITLASAPIRDKIFSANNAPRILTNAVAKNATIRDWAPACDAPSGFFSPILLATIAVAAVLKPMAIE